MVSACAGHQVPAIAEAVLTEGVAALAIAVVVLALGRAARGHAARRLASLTEVAGLAAAWLSLVQCILGLFLASRVPPEARRGQFRAGHVFELFSRVDGVKMLLLAVVAVSVIGPGQACPGRRRLTPAVRWRSR